MATENYEYDVFISYAVEDKIGIVNELVQKLEDYGIKVWYASHRLRVGRGISDTIKDGINRSKHAVVVLSHHYLSKSWPKKEYHILWGNETIHGKKILPIWHNITEEEIKNFDPFLADNYGLDSTKGLDYIVKELVENIHPEKEILPANHKINSFLNVKKKLTSQLILASVLVGLILILVLQFLMIDAPPEQLIKSVITERITTLQNKIDSAHQSDITSITGSKITNADIANYIIKYNSIKAPYNDFYIFNTGYEVINFKKSVIEASGIDVDILNIYNNYGFKSPEILLLENDMNSSSIKTKYTFLNTQPVTYKVIEKNKLSNSDYTVAINYENNIRKLTIALSYLKGTDEMKQTHIILNGMKSSETYSFRKEEDQWIFNGIK